MAADIKTMMVLRGAVRAFMASTTIPNRVEASLAPGGPEIHVLVTRQDLKRTRLLLPAEKNGVPVIVKVVRSI